MPKFKLFKLLSLTHKNAEPLHRLPSPRPVDTNLVVTQLTRTSDIPTTIDNDLLHSSKITETQPTITSAEETTNDITNKPSTAKSKHNDDLSGICTSSSPTQKPQNIYSQSPATDIPNFLTEPANSTITDTSFTTTQTTTTSTPPLLPLSSNRSFKISLPQKKTKTKSKGHQFIDQLTKLFL